MGEQTTFQFSIDGRTIAAQPRPEDQSTLDELLRRGANVTVAAAPRSAVTPPVVLNQKLA